MIMKCAKFFYYPLILLCLLPAISNAQGWERLFPASYTSYGIQVFVQDDDTYLINAKADDIYYWMIVDNEGYLLSSTPYPTSAASAFMIESFDGNFVSATNTYTTSPSDSNDIRLSKIDLNGNIIWEYYFGSDSQNQRVSALTQDNNGDYFFAGGIGNPAPSQGYVSKVDEDGNLLWSTILAGSIAIHNYKIVATPDGGCFVSGYSTSVDDAFIITRLDANGNQLWHSNSYPDFRLRDLVYTNDGNIALLGPDGNGTKLIKLDENGEELWVTHVPFSGGRVLIETSDGGFAFIASYYGGNVGLQITLVKTDQNGDLEWQQFYYASSGNHQGNDLKQTSDGGYIITGAGEGENTNNIPEYAEHYLVKTDAYGNSFNSVIQGFLQYDLNENCLNDVDEQALEDWIVSAVGSDRTYYGIVDETGYYQIRADTGTYEVDVQLPNNYWLVCDEMIPVQLAQLGDSIMVDIPVQSIEQCPLLEIQTSASTYQLCENSSFHVSYCNQGTGAVDDITIEITFDEALSVINASAPILSQSGNTYIFDGGALDFLECTHFSVNLSVDCDVDLLGQTLCTEAHIYPDSSCLPIDPLWSGASITANAYCDGDSVRLELHNVGSGDMEGPLNYIVVEDDVIMISEPYQLNIGEVLPLAFPADGSFYRIESPQEPYHPGNSMPSAHVEACVSGMGQEISLGFVNQYPLNDNDPFIDIHCQEVAGAYDPNYKEASPRGYQEDHFIEPNTTIDYTIHFQNTGTDTAFKVVIQDILSPLLNPASFRKGVASHPYEVELTSEDVLIFTFDNIMLPDSNINEPASHGFVQFSIEQQANLAPGTVINNEAGIYFDFNPPIITNRTYHTIEEDFIAVFVDEILLPEVTVKVYPNPFFNSTTFEVDGIDSSPLQFNLLDATGRQLRSEMFTGLQFNLHRDGLPGGIYFYTIQRNGKNINTGKIIAY